MPDLLPLRRSYIVKPLLPLLDPTGYQFRCVHLGFLEITVALPWVSSSDE